MARWASRVLSSLAVAAGLALGAAAPAGAALSPVLSATCVTDPADTPSASDASRHGWAAVTGPGPLWAVAQVPFREGPEHHSGPVRLAASAHHLTSADPAAAAALAGGAGTPFDPAPDRHALPAGAAPTDLPAPAAAVVAATADGPPAGPAQGVLGSRAPPAA